MPVIHGVKSFNSLRSRAEQVELGKRKVWVADLADIIASKRAAGRLVIKPCTKFWKRRCMKKVSRHRKRKAALKALRAESERAELDSIRRRLALPVEKRLNFLRVRLPGGGSCL